MSAADANRREELALDALVAASLRCVEGEVSEAEVAAFSDPQIVLTPDDEKAIRGRYADEIFVDRRKRRNVAPPKTSVAGADALFMAMNRKNAEDVHCDESRQELDRKRLEILEKLKARKKPRDAL